MVTKPIIINKILIRILMVNLHIIINKRDIIRILIANSKVSSNKNKIIINFITRNNLHFITKINNSSIKRLRKN